jgi:peptide/nickel transport system ATP-binding protein
MNADPPLAGASPGDADPPSEPPLLEVRDLAVEFDVDGTRQMGVRSASFAIERTQTLAIVGESGSGKTVTAMSILGLMPKNATVSGSIRFEGRELLGLGRREMRRLRGSGIGLVFQDPVAALDPVFTVGFQLAEVVRLHDPSLNREQVRERVVDLLTLVGIASPARRVGDFPHRFSDRKSVV